MAVQSHGLDPRWPCVWLPSSQCTGQHSEIPIALAQLLIDFHVNSWASWQNWAIGHIDSTGRRQPRAATTLEQVTGILTSNKDLYLRGHCPPSARKVKCLLRIHIPRFPDFSWKQKFNEQFPSNRTGVSPVFFSTFCLASVLADANQLSTNEE